MTNTMNWCTTNRCMDGFQSGLKEVEFGSSGVRMKIKPKQS